MKATKRVFVWLIAVVCVITTVMNPLVSSATNTDDTVQNFFIANGGEIVTSDGSCSGFTELNWPAKATLQDYLANAKWDLVSMEKEGANFKGWTVIKYDSAETKEVLANQSINTSDPNKKYILSHTIYDEATGLSKDCWVVLTNAVEEPNMMSTDEIMKLSGDVSRCFIANWENDPNAGSNGSNNGSQNDGNGTVQKFFIANGGEIVTSDGSCSGFTELNWPAKATLKDYLDNANWNLVSMEKEGAKFKGWTVIKYDSAITYEVPANQSIDTSNPDNRYILSHTIYDGATGLSKDCWVVLINAVEESNMMSTDEIMKLPGNVSRCFIANWENDPNAGSNGSNNGSNGSNNGSQNAGNGTVQKFFIANGGEIVTDDGSCGGFTELNWPAKATLKEYLESANWNLVSMEKEGANFKGWTVIKYDSAITYEVPANQSIDTSNPDNRYILSHTIYDEATGLSKDCWVVLTNAVEESNMMSTDEIMKLPGNVSRCFIANWENNPNAGANGGSEDEDVDIAHNFFVANGGEIVADAKDEYGETIQGIRTGFTQFGCPAKATLQEYFDNIEWKLTSVIKEGVNFDGWIVTEYTYAEVQTLPVDESIDTSNQDNKYILADTFFDEEENKWMNNWLILVDYDEYPKKMSTEEIMELDGSVSHCFEATWKDAHKYKNGVCTVCGDSLVAEGTVPGIDASKPNDVQVGTNKEMLETITNAIAELIDAIVSETVTEEMKDVFSDELINAIAEEIEAGNQISTEIIANVVTEDKVDASAAKEIKEKLGKNGKVAQYLDLTVIVKSVSEDGTEKELGTLTELDEGITFTITIPKNLVQDGREFYILRNHNGEVDKLALTKNADGTYSFKTDRFSTYALAYNEVVESDAEKILGSEETKKDNGVKSDNENTATTSTDNKAVKTGDSNEVLGYSIMVVMLLVVLLVASKRRYFVK